MPITHPCLGAMKFIESLFLGKCHHQLIEQLLCLLIKELLLSMTYHNLIPRQLSKFVGFDYRGKYCAWNDTFDCSDSSGKFL